MRARGRTTVTLLDGMHTTRPERTVLDEAARSTREAVPFCAWRRAAEGRPVSSSHNPKFSPDFCQHHRTRLADRPLGSKHTRPRLGPSGMNSTARSPGTFTGLGFAGNRPGPCRSSARADGFCSREARHLATYRARDKTCSVSNFPSALSSRSSP